MLPGCFPLSRESAISHRVSFAREVAVIESSPLLFSPAEEPEDLTEATEGDREPLDWGHIQFTQPAYVLFPSEEPMDDSDGVSTLGFPSLPAPPGFIQTVRPGDIPEPAGPSSLFDSSPMLPGWYPRRPRIMLKMC